MSSAVPNESCSAETLTTATPRQDSTVEGPQSGLVQDLDEYFNEIQELKTQIHTFKSLQAKVNSEETLCLNALNKKKKVYFELFSSLSKACKGSQPNKNDPQQQISLSEGPQQSLAYLNSYMDKLNDCKKELNTLQCLFPKEPHFLLKFALGSANFSLGDSKKIPYKTQYESFKLQFTILCFIFSILNLYFISSLWIDIFLYFLLLYYYSSITLREHILQVNGSKIRTWWSIHHYLSIALAGTLLIWPSSESLNKFRSQFLVFSIYISGVQYLQYRYQMSRLYTLRALSKIGPMDVTTDSAQVHVRNNLAFLLPFLLAGQVFQCYNAYTLYNLWKSSPSPDYHALILCIIFTLIGVGNFSTTLHTFYVKIKKNKV